MFCRYFYRMTGENQEKRRRKGLILWVFLGLLVVTNGITLWMLMQEKEEVVREKVVIQKVSDERDNLSADLVELQHEYETLQTNDIALQKEIDEKKILIAELVKEAAKHKDDAYIIAKLRKE